MQGTGAQPTRLPWQHAGARVLDNPDALVEIADWDSAEARDAHMQVAAATGIRTAA